MVLLVFNCECFLVVSVVHLSGAAPSPIPAPATSAASCCAALLRFSAGSLQVLLPVVLLVVVLLLELCVRPPLGAGVGVSLS